MKNEKVWKIAMTGVFAALSYVVFTFLQFKIWLPGGDATSIHFGNAVCVLGALILGGVYGGAAFLPIYSKKYTVMKYFKIFSSKLKQPIDI